jgi:hypothetical protein
MLYRRDGDCLRGQFSVIGATSGLGAGRESFDLVPYNAVKTEDEEGDW